MYNTKHGDKEFALQIAIERGQKPPKWLQEKPELDYRNLFYWNSFNELSTCRYEISNIPWTAISEYCNRWNISTPEDFDTFTYIIRRMDNVYLDEHHKRLKEKK